jgi:antitoxin component of MazEF toxin-antitoxin module
VNRKIFKTGHSMAVTVSKRMLRELGLENGDNVDVELGPDRKEIVIKKAKKSSQLDLGLKVRHHLGEKV